MTRDEFRYSKPTEEGGVVAREPLTTLAPVQEHPAVAAKGAIPRRVGELPADQQTDFQQEPAPSDRSPYGAVREYSQPKCSLPMEVPASEIARQNIARWGNIGPADSEARAPMLNGTKVVGQLDGLRRSAGGK